MIATLSNEEVKIWNCNHDKVESCTSPQLSPDTNKGKLLSLSWNHTNQVIAVSNSFGQIQLFHAQSGQNLSTIPFENDNTHNTLNNTESPSHCISFSDNSRYIAQSLKSSVLIWDLKKRALKNDLFDINNNNNTHNNNTGSNSNNNTQSNIDVSSLSFLPDGKLISGDVSGVIRIWDLKSSQLVNHIIAPSASSSTTNANANNISSPSISISSSSLSSITCLKSANNKIAASYSNGSIAIYDLHTSTLLRHQFLHTQSISCLNFSPKNSRLVATCGLDGKLMLTDINSKNGSEPTATIVTGGMLTSLSFHEDGVHTAVSTSTGKFMMFDWRNIKKPVLQFDAHPSSIINAIAFQNPAPVGSSSSSSASSVISSNTNSSNTASGNSVSPRVSQQQQKQQQTPQQPITPVSLSTNFSGAVPTSTNSNNTAATNIGPTGAADKENSNSVSNNSSSSSKSNTNSLGSSEDDNIMSSAKSVRGGSSIKAEPSYSTYNSARQQINGNSDIDISAPTVDISHKNKQQQRQQEQQSIDQLNTSYTSVVSSVGDYTAAIAPTIDNFRVANTPIKQQAFSNTNNTSQNIISSNNKATTSLSPLQQPMSSSSSSKINDIVNSNGNGNNSSNKITDRDENYYLQQQQQLKQQSSSSSSIVSPIPNNLKFPSSSGGINDNNTIYGNDDTSVTNIIQRDYNDSSTSYANLKRAIQPVTHQQLQESLVSLRYDIHKDVQNVLREQNRLFALAKEDTAELFDTMKDMLQQLLDANRELRIENERLRHIY